MFSMEFVGPWPFRYESSMQRQFGQAALGRDNVVSLL